MLTRSLLPCLCVLLRPRQFTASIDASASFAVISCDLLVVACGMMSSAFLATLMDGAEGNAAAASGALQELGRFTVTADDAAATAAAPSSKQAKAAAARPYALILAQQPGSSTLYAFNYLRVGAPQYFSLTAALFERVKAKQSVPRISNESNANQSSWSEEPHCEARSDKLFFRCVLARCVEFCCWTR